MNNLRPEFVGKYPVRAIITQRNNHIDRRVYVDSGGIRYVKINGNFYTVTDFQRIGDKVDIYF